jgi:hypothetical protein
MLCERVSLFTKVTREPADTVTCVALTPEAVMVIVAEASDGDEGEPPPHAVTSKPNNASRPVRTSRLWHQRRHRTRYCTTIDPRNAPFEASR